jgi:hypothetical protein
MIDFQGLLNVVKAAEAEPNLIMDAWINELSPCGTSHCMIGAFCDQHPTDKLKIVHVEPLKSWTPEFENQHHISAISARFKISEDEAQWLFVAPWFGWVRCQSATKLSKTQAIARLRKFIYYKMHKNEMTYEEARNVEGNKAVVVAKEKVLCLQN